MNELTQKALEQAVLELMHHTMNEGRGYLIANDLVGGLNGMPAQRIQMALRTLEREKLVSGRHNTMTGSSYEISEDGYKSVEAELEQVNEQVEVADDIPAADRAVTLTHNQISEIDKPTEEIIDLLDKENSIDGDGSMRSLVLGKIRAGRELIRAGIFELETLQMTLIAGLKLLVEKYKDHAIGAAASNLLAVLINHVSGIQV